MLNAGPIKRNIFATTDKDLEPFACVSPGRDVLIDVSSRTEDIPLPFELLRALSLTCFTLAHFSDHQHTFY